MLGDHTVANDSGCGEEKIFQGFIAHHQAKKKNGCCVPGKEKVLVIRPAHVKSVLQERIVEVDRAGRGLEGEQEHAGRPQDRHGGIKLQGQQKGVGLASA